MPKGISDNTDRKSLAGVMRLRRMSFFKGLLAKIPRPVRILDAGGTEKFWEVMGVAGDSQYQITVLNLEKFQPVHSNLQSQAGDARQMAFSDRSFEVVFSNSVIEHVGGWEDQQRMAKEIRRVGKRYFVQTPNRYFPIEPHFLFPFFQFLPVAARACLIRHFDLGWRKKIPDREKAEAEARSVRLLTRRELLGLFPGGSLKEEKIAGLTKSFMIYGGFGGPDGS